MIEKFISFLNRYQYDKALHGIYFTLFFLFQLAIIGKLGSISSFVNSHYTIMVALYITIIFSALKEIYDGTKKNHTRDFMDFLASIYIPIIITLILKYKYGL
jgi:hypothetical protein